MSCPVVHSHENDHVWATQASPDRCALWGCTAAAQTNTSHAHMILGPTVTWVKLPDWHNATQSAVNEVTVTDASFLMAQWCSRDHSLPGMKLSPLNPVMRSLLQRRLGGTAVQQRRTPPMAHSLVLKTSCTLMTQNAQQGCHSCTSLAE